MHSTCSTVPTWTRSFPFMGRRTLWGPYRGTSETASPGPAAPWEPPELGPSYSLADLLDTQLVYMRVEGTKAVCQSVAEMEGVQPEDVQVTTGAAEALLLLFTLAAEPGANILVPSLGFPSFYEIP